MMRIPAAVAYNKYFKVYQPKFADIVNTTDNITPEAYQMDISRGTLQVLTKLSVNNIKYQQEVYRQQIVDFNSTAKDLSAAAKAVAASGFFDKKQVGASSQAVTGQAGNAAKTAQYDVTVSQLASAQKNVGLSISRTAAGSLDAGVYALGVRVGSGTEQPVMVHVGTAENNARILEKFAEAINEAKTGVTAAVKTAGSQSYLTLEAAKTGQANSFSIRDITGNAAQALNLGNQVTAAADARYSVNGHNGVSDQNTVSLDDGNLKLHIRAVTAGSVQVNVSADTAAIAGDIGKLVERYNAFSNQLTGANNITARGEKVLTGIKAVLTQARSGDFQSVGVTWDFRNDRILLDQAKLTRALQQKPAEVASLFSGSAGLGSVLETTAQTVLANPVSAYLQEPNLLDSIDYGWRRNSQSFLYSGFNVSNQGLFLDMFI